MKIIIIGAGGTIGKSLAAHFSVHHEVIGAGRKSGMINADLSDRDSLVEMFKKTGVVDAVICVAGEAAWAPFKELTDVDFHIGIRSKLMGQVNLVKVSQDYIHPNGSVTLTSGILGDHPVLKTTSAAMVNGGINSFVRAVSLELENGIRINAVSSGLVADSYEKYKDFFPGHHPVPMKKVVKAYARSVHGKITGKIIRVRPI